MKRFKKRARKWLANSGGRLAFSLGKRFIGKKDPIKAEAAGRRLGRLGYRFGKKHRTRALANLEMVFPNLSSQDREALAKRCFEHFGMLAADFLRTDHRTQEEVVESLEIEGWEHAEAALAADRGIIGITGHIGNWERFGAFVASRGMPLHVVQRDANDPGLNQEMTRMREKAGLIVLSRGNAARAMLEAIRNKKLVAVLADQNCSESFVPFFGFPTGTVLGPAVMHKRTGAPLLPSYCVRTGPNRYKIIFHELLTPDLTEEDPLIGLTKAMNQSLERIITEYPEQWLWLHDRWKSARRKGLIPSS